MADFAAWCNNQGAAADGLHNAVSGVFWWAWNANSGQTSLLNERAVLKPTKLAWCKKTHVQQSKYLEVVDTSREGC